MSAGWVDLGQCAEPAERSLKSPLSSADAHIHHLVPRAFGGGDREDNLITLCDGCHANKHRNLQVGLGRRMLEQWAVRIARWLDRELVGKAPLDKLGITVRIFGISRLRQGQLEAILAAFRGESVLFAALWSHYWADPRYLADAWKLERMVDRPILEVQSPGRL
jgi:hypothetical protein